MADSNNDVLQRHRARFEAHRQWLREQQASLSDVGAGGLSARTSNAPGSARTGGNSARQHQPHPQQSSSRANSYERAAADGGDANPAARTTQIYQQQTTTTTTSAAAHQQMAAGGGVTAPAYSQAQRVQRTSAAAQWVEEVVAHEQSREPLSRDRPTPVATDDGYGGYNNSLPQTSRSGYDSRRHSAGPSVRGGGGQQRQQYDSGYDNEEMAGGMDGGEGMDMGGHGYDEEDAYYNNQQQQQQHDDDQRSQYSAAQLMLMEGSPLHVYSRATQWARRKEQKLLEMREAVEAQEMSKCTFKPDRPRVRASSNAPSHYVGNDGYRYASALTTTANDHNASYADTSMGGMGADVPTVAAISGYEEFMCRRLRAKQITEEKKSRLRSDGSRWTGAPTVIEEFNLGVNASGKRLQKILKPPVAAPHVGNRAAVGASIMLPPSSSSHQQQGGFSNRYGGHANNNNASFATNNNTSFVNNHSMSSNRNYYGSPSSPPRAADVPPTTSERQLPPKGLFSLRGSSTFVEGMANGNGAPNGEIFE